MIGKLEPRAKKIIFLGYATKVKGYKLWCLDSKSPNLLLIGMLLLMKITSLKRERSLLLILHVQKRKQASRWSLRAKLQKEYRKAHTLNQSMMLKVPFWVMIYL